METSTIFLGLTRPPTFGGLPLTYVIVLMMVCVGGFIATSSFIYLVVSGAVGYGVMRFTASKDVQLLDAWMVILRETPPRPSQFQGRGVTYRA